MPKVSVVMPAYNTPEIFLRSAVESVLAQTFVDFELLVIDDASTADIQKIVSSYKDKRIKYRRMPKNGGAAAARNAGIKLASGAYVAFLDSDDVCAAQRLQKQVEYLDKHPDIGCVASAVDIMCNTKRSPKFPVFAADNEIKKYLLFKGCAFCQSSVMLRAEILKSHKLYYDSAYVPAEDYKFWLDLLPFTKFAILPDELVTYRFYDENISNRQKKLQNSKCAEAQLKAIEKYYGIKWSDFGELQKFLTLDNVDAVDYPSVKKNIKKAIETLHRKGLSADDVSKMFQVRYKKRCYHTRTLKGQWQLLTSSMYRQLNLSFGWQFFCFITRGVL